MEIIYTKSAAKTLRRMESSRAIQILTAITGLTKQPPKGDIKPMQGAPGEYRLRIGDYRVIYRYEKDSNLFTVLLVLKIGSRGDVYK